MAKRKVKRNRDKPMNAIELLTADHKAVKKLHKQYKSLMEDEADADERGAVATEICTALTAHATAEDEIFYPAVRKAIGEPDLMDEADIEHASAKDLIAQIESMQPDDDHYDARVIVLCEYVDHHVKEEEKEIFPKARRARKKLDLEAIGAKLAARKAQLMPPDTDDDDSDDDELEAPARLRTALTAGRRAPAMPSRSAVGRR